jgi:hypothetical protein
MDIFEMEMGGKTRKFLLTVDFYSDFFEIDEVTNLSAATTITICKRNFGRHGIPTTVCTDNATNFKSEEFAAFAKSWEFEHVTSSPNHQQGNGKSEAAVKIAKNLLKKSIESGEEFYKALLIWRNTPNKIGSSPAQRIFSRTTRNPIPTTNEKLRPRIAENVTTQIEIQRQKTKNWYDKHTKILPNLSEDQKVFIKKKPSDDKWKPGIVTAKLGERKYMVDVDGRSLVRNRTHIKAPAHTSNLETESQDEHETDHMQSSPAQPQMAERIRPKSNIIARHDYMRQRTPKSENVVNEPDNRNYTTPQQPVRETNKTQDTDSGVNTPQRRPVRETRAPRRLWDYILK